MKDPYQKRVRKWLNAVLIQTGLTASELARRSGVATTTLTRFLNSEEHNYTLSGRTIAKIADSTGIPFEGESAMPLKKAVVPVNDAFTTVPIYDIRASAGAGALVEDGEPTGHQPFREQEISRLTRASSMDLAVIQVAGDSMWETLHDGDKVLVDRTVSRVVRDGIYILSYEEELLVKRCQRDLETGEVIVMSDNPAYQAFRVSGADKLSVIGRVVWIGRALG